MIKKLKIKFVILAMSSLLALLAVIIGGMNLINYFSVTREADAILSILSQNNGSFPDFPTSQDDFLPPDMSPEIPFESRYFSVVLDDNYKTVSVNTDMIASVDQDQAKTYAQEIVDKKNSQGFIDEYRYVLKEENNEYRITFLDCGRKLDFFRNFLMASSSMALAGYIVVFIIIFILSGKIIKPIAESYEKQKRFITDAGHEIKTPLTIINANIDILEMDIGKNESLSDIAVQTGRLRSLTDSLVMLARMEESEENLQKIDFPVSEVVTEAAMPFRMLAIQQEKEFRCNIQPLLTLKGNDKAIGQLVGILLDNALKYSPHGGTIFLDLTKQNHYICLSVFNTANSEVKSEQLSHVFERFYRTDSSRNSEMGGHGIGLSIAQAIVTAHSGKIQATMQDGHSFRITALFPA